jgi:hypothetical protein
MARRIDPRYVNNLIDAHVLDRTGGPQDTAVDLILELAAAGAMTVLLPHSVKTEIEHPNTPDDVKRRAIELIYTEPVQLTPQELALHQKIRNILRGKAKPGKHDRDAYHVVESAKYGGYFITNDERLLRKAPEIADLLHIEIVTPLAFMNQYERFQKEQRG